VKYGILTDGIEYSFRSWQLLNLSGYSPSP